MTANKPVEFQKQAIAAGTQLTMTGSFVRRLGGKFSTVVWGNELGSSQPFDAALPAENSPYAQLLRDKIAEVRTKQAAEGLTDFIGTVGVEQPGGRHHRQLGPGNGWQGGGHADGQGNERPRWRGDPHACKRRPSGAPPVKQAFETTVGAARMISGFFGKK